MNKITLHLENGSNDVYLNNSFIKANVDTKMLIKNIAIFLDFHNIETEVNNTIFITNRAGTRTKVIFDEGYWTFNMIRDKLTEYNVIIERNVHNNTCKIYENKQAHSDIHNIELKNFGKLLGFPTNHTLRFGNTPINSPNVVDVNRGLRYVTIGCRSVNNYKNFDTNGNRSNVIATIPVTSYQPLNSTVTYFNDINSEVPMINGFHNVLKFEVGTNIGHDVKLTALFECYIK